MPAGRFAPTPSGRLHLGNLRTALVAWLFARHDGSPFHLRFDDLDERATKQEHYRTQLDDLRAIGLDWDEPVIHQGARRSHYEPFLEQLVDAELVYPCYCSRREVREAAQAPNAPLSGHHYPGTCRNLDSSARRRREAGGRRPALRFRTTETSVGFDDLLAGPVEYEVDDFVVERNDGTPAYHLATVVDDAEMGVELVVRADDLLDSTSRQLTLARALDLHSPAHAHLPLVLNSDGERLAKRHGAITLADRAGRGESPVDVLRYLAASLGLVGAWSSPARAEESTVPPTSATSATATARELIGRFDPTSLPRRPLLLDSAFLDNDSDRYERS